MRRKLLEQGDVPPEFGAGKLTQIVPPPDFVMFQNLKHQIA